jgi:hypothetical protein
LLIVRDADETYAVTTPYPGHKNCPLPTKLEDTYRALKEMRLRVDSLKNDKDKAVVLMNMKQSVITVSIHHTFNNFVVRVH